ncbi:uncharacterized protein LOC126653487 [Mercurialis annua]|uniref:uncharacterized protein LOC126653487 n=1 Tax=Mercurialis annua TaxID=3986 RepID=UPI00215DE256|nr:uncharacterized protein LOC126653487 [Mercurialis annua]
MDCLTFKPTFNFFFSNPTTNNYTKSLYPLNKHLKFFKSTKFKKTVTPVCFSFTPTPPSNPQNPTSKNNNLLQKLKIAAFSQTKKWVTWLQSYTEESEKAMSDYSDNNYLQNGGFGVALLSITSNAKVKISPFVATLAANPTFISGLIAWVCAQSIKVVLNFFVEKKWDFRILCASGGMPSSHSALCTALTTAVALCHGVADSLFPVCLGFSLIVMYDAIGVRRHAGMQAEVLNMIVEDLFQGHPISQRKLKELLGHTPSQVLAGALLGILVACYCCQVA